MQLLNNAFRIAFDRIKISETISVSVAIVVILGLLEALLYLFSLNFVVYEGWVSWYFPVGINLVSFILLPFRYWPAIFLGQAMGQLCFNHLYYNYEISELWLSLFTDWPDKILALLPLIYLKNRKTTIAVDRLKGIMLIISVALFYRGTRSIYMILYPPLDGLYVGIPDPMLLQIIVSHILGGFIGVIFSIMLVYSGMWCWNNYRSLIWNEFLEFWLSLSILVVSTYLVFLFHPDVIYLLRMIGILTFVWFAFRYGWIGVIIAALSLNFLLLISSFRLINTEIMLENQIFITTYGLSALLLGALVNEYEIIEKQLIKNNQQLVLKNKKLLSLNKDIRSLSERVTSVRDLERKNLTQTLHDELGQNIVALRMGLQIVANEARSVSKESLNFLSKSVDEISSTMYELMHWNQPKVSIDGLFNTIDGSYFRKKLSHLNITLHTELKGNENALTEALEISIFRTIQEAATNTIKHSNAENFYVQLVIESKEIRLRISDDGNTADFQPVLEGAGGFGLSGIKDRVLAFSGKLNLETRDGFEINIVIPNKIQPSL